MVKLSNLSLAAALGGSASASPGRGGGLRLERDPRSRSLQASISCLVALPATPEKDFADCCPGPTDASTGEVTDGICNLLWCVDLSDVSIRDGLGCDCGQLEAACGLVAPYAAAVPQAGIEAMCASVDSCCDAEAGTDDGAWGSCMATAVENGDFSVPDFGALIPGGVPDIDALVAQQQQQQAGGPDGSPAAGPEGEVPGADEPAPPDGGAGEPPMDGSDEEEPEPPAGGAEEPTTPPAGAEEPPPAEEPAGDPQGEVAGADEPAPPDGGAGEPPPVEETAMCTMDWTPVCGADGKVYSNACAAEASNVTVSYKIDPVPEDLAAGADCPEQPEAEPVEPQTTEATPPATAAEKDETATEGTPPAEPTGAAVDPILVDGTAGSSSTEAPPPPGADPTAPAGTTVPPGSDGDATSGAAATESGAPPVLGAMPPSVMCVAQQKPFLECCPAPSDADGICTMLHCVDLSGEAPGLGGGCGCAQVEAACDQLTAIPMAIGAVPQLPGMCAAADACCQDETTDEDWGTCMGTKLEAGEYEMPDFGSIIPGGLPDLTGGGGASVAATTTTSSTVPAAAAGAPEPEPGSGAGACRVLGVGACVVGSALAALLA